MGKKKEKSSAQVADTIRDNPKKIIEWALSEIKEYEKLIKILQDRENRRK